MKSLQQSQNSSFVGLISIIIFYLLLIILILVFSNQILSDIALGRTVSNVIIIPFAIILPLFLIGTIVYNIIKLARERRRGIPGTRYKSKLVLFFTLVAFMASIPQGILSISFINTMTKSWFSSQYGDTLESGVQLALTYYNERLENLESIADSALVASLLRDMETRADKTWETLEEVNSGIHSIQIFDDEGRETLFRGIPEGRMESLALLDVSEGILPKETKKDTTILRVLIGFTQGGEEKFAVISTILPANFDSTAENLTKTLEIFTQLERYRNIFRYVLIGFYFFFSFPIMLLAILVSFILSEEIIRPIVNLEEATKRVSEGDFSIRILSRAKDELSILIESFNRMVAELEKSRRQLIHTEKITAWQDIAQRMAHEIKNPLTPIKLSAQRILRKYEAGEKEFSAVLKPAVSSIIQEVEKLNNLLVEFRDFARLPDPDMEQISLKELVEEAASVFTTSYPSITIHTKDIVDSILILADRDQITRAFTNLFKNALDAISGEGDIYIRADLVIKGNLHYCRIQVQDTGTGITEENLDKIFNPYFTTKDKGTGLGLSIVERIVLDHKGQIWFETEEGAGTTFFIDLPAGLSTEDLSELPTEKLIVSRKKRKK